MSELFDFGEFPRLETERLILREVVAADAEAIFQFRSDPLVQKHNGEVPHKTVVESQALIVMLSHSYREKRSIGWGVTLKGEDRVIGLCGYNTWERNNFYGDIGYDMAQAYWGREIMPEAVRAIIGFGFEHMNLNHIEILVNTENTASVRLAQKLGFTLEGQISERYFEDGAFHDVSIYTLLRRNFRPK